LGADVVGCDDIEVELAIGVELLHTHHPSLSDLACQYRFNTLVIVS
jgi:hypothetical protein